MTMSDDTRIYVQMAPDTAGRAALQAIGASLPVQRSGRLLPADELHVTLIHFGKASDVRAAIQREVPISDRLYTQQLDRYITATRALLSGKPYQLMPLGYDRFGTRETTLVARYEAPRELHEIHDRAYAQLLHFLASCGIGDAETFAASDPNFRFARLFTPHVTIFKGYDGPDPLAAPPLLIVSFMPLVY